MTLSFPTLAEQCLTQAQATHKPISSIAPNMGAMRDDEGNMIVWVFEDDTTIEITGRGRQYKAEAFCP